MRFAAGDLVMMDVSIITGQPGDSLAGRVVSVHNPRPVPNRRYQVRLHLGGFIFTAHSSELRPLTEREYKFNLALGSK